MIVTINIGSSSARIGLYDNKAVLAHMEQFEARAQYSDLVAWLKAFLAEHANSAPVAVCHRIVHAGADHTESCILGEAVERSIEKHAPLAPLHNPAALRWISAAKVACPAAIQVAVFDTGFFASLPDVAARYALPKELTVRRLGFHGLAHRWMIRQVRIGDPEVYAQQRVISLQLGSGCSVAASRGGRAIDTSMGYTPLEGLVMGTRSGDIDPGLVLHLLKERGRTPEAVETLLGKQSGLLGLSGRSADIRELIESTDEQAKLAVDMFCYRARKYIGAYAAVLGGVDHIVFGGGIGEHQPEIRARILDGLEFLGLALDPEANAKMAGESGSISRSDSSVLISVSAIEENRLMAEDTLNLLPGGSNARKRGIS